jgi:hypothetical protein
MEKVVKYSIRIQEQRLAEIKKINTHAERLHLF